jgi:hypothetical protein
MKTARDFVGRAAKRGQVVRLEQTQAFLGREPLARDPLRE